MRRPPDELGTGRPERLGLTHSRRGPTGAVWRPGVARVSCAQDAESREYQGDCRPLPVERASRRVLLVVRVQPPRPSPHPPRPV